MAAPATHASKVLPFCLLSSSSLALSSGVFSDVAASRRAILLFNANLLPSARSLTRDEVVDTSERKMPVSQHLYEIRWIRASFLQAHRQWHFRGGS